MTAPEKIGKLVQTASLFEHKEILITVSGREKDEILDFIEGMGELGEIEYHALDGQTFLNVRTFTYSGVTIHLNVV